MRTEVDGERLYGLDWLRIGAFALLILYHIGMFFVPWDWHVKTSEPLEWLELPMLAVNPWRLALLFLISGVASRILLSKMSGPGNFASSRSSRLLVPLAAGMAIFVAPQAWAELSAASHYPGGFWTFWTQEYFRFGELHGVILPTWNHLWFVAYLWVYSVLLALFAMLPASARNRLQDAFDRCFDGWRLLVLPIAYLAAARMIAFPVFNETHALVDDAYAHLVYGFAFFFGVGIARSPAAWPSIARLWKYALALAVAAYAVIVLFDLTIPGEASELEIAVLRICRSIQAWGAIIGLIGLARIHLHRDGTVRRYLTKAIFPYYIAHQTIIVLAGYWLAPLGLGSGAEFATILVATLLGCAATYELGRRVGWLRPLIGLKPRPRDRVHLGPAVAQGQL